MVAKSDDTRKILAYRGLGPGIPERNIGVSREGWPATIGGWSIRLGHVDSAGGQKFADSWRQTNEDEGWLVGFRSNLETGRRQCPWAIMQVPLAGKGKGGIAHIRTDSNSWCLCLVAGIKFSARSEPPQPSSWPQTRRWAISGSLSVSTLLDHLRAAPSFFIPPSLRYALRLPRRRLIPSPDQPQRSKPDASTFLEGERTSLALVANGSCWSRNSIYGTIRWIPYCITDRVLSMSPIRGVCADHFVGVVTIEYFWFVALWRENGGAFNALEADVVFIDNGKVLFMCGKWTFRFCGFLRLCDVLMLNIFISNSKFQIC